MHRDATNRLAYEVDLREQKLPLWAQQKMAALRRATIDAVKAYDELRDGTKPSAFYLEDYDGNDKRFYLADRGRLMFGERYNRLRLYQDRGDMEDGWLTINGDAPLLIRPSSSNHVRIKVES